MSNVNDAQELMQSIRGFTSEKWSNDAIQLATHASMDSTQWSLGIFNSLENKGFEKQIEELSKYQAYPNPFFELPILKPSIKHLGDNKIQFLYMSERVGAYEKLKFFAPIKFEKTKLMRRPYARIWSNIYAPLSHPIIDHKNQSDTINALIQLMLSPNSDQPMVLLFDEMPKNSLFCKTLYSSENLADKLFQFSLFERASFNSVAGKSYDDLHVSGKRRQRLRKAKDALEKHGQIRFKCATTPNDIKQDLDEMLRLEEASWKGKKGTALLSDKKLTNLAYENVLSMAERNQCELYSLTLEGKMLAGIIFYKNGDCYFPWKTAYDENFANYSVGNLLVNRVNQTLSLDASFKSIDSLASEENETANRMWPDKIEFCSIAIGLGKGGGDLAKKVVEELTLQRKTKRFAKKILRA